MSGKERRKKARRRRAVACGLLLTAFISLCTHLQDTQQVSGHNPAYKIARQALTRLGSNSWAIEQELEDMLEKNMEAADFVAGYQERDNYLGQPIDLTEDFQSGTVPLLMQWDKRWGYEAYGDSRRQH